MSAQPKLERHTQIALGEALRAYLAPTLNGIPPQFTGLWHRLRASEGKRRDAPPCVPSAPAARSDGTRIEGIATQCFDPETLALLNAAFDEGWTILSSISGIAVRKEALAERILAIAGQGERSVSRLASKALISVIAPRAKIRSAV